ncbi:MAG TPA: integrin alpha [Planctomycetota bacterium]|nr:integrin alpha [Planctomycetota bacterium]
MNVYSGRTGGLLLHLQGQRTGDHFGWSVSGLGDYDSDGFGDLIVGAPLHEWTEATGGIDRGAVYLISGIDGHQIWKYGGVSDDSWLGWVVLGLGDIDGNGQLDYAMSEPGMDLIMTGEIGRVTIMTTGSFPMAHDFLGEDAGDYFGYSMANIGDVTGDGRVDLVVGAPYYDTGFALPAGRAYLCKLVQPPAAPIPLMTGSSTGGHLGFSVGGGFDFDADGVGDFALGEPYYKIGGIPRGRVRVLSGATLSLAQTINGTDDDLLGYSVAGLADADGDGHGDLMVGLPGGDIGGNVDFGVARMYSGATWQAGFEINGYHADERMGHCVASAGDLNADGASDIICGANSSDLHGTNCGRVRVVLGNTSFPSAYCTAKTNSVFCIPSIFYTGCPSASIGDNFRIHASSVLLNKVGLLIWSRSAASIPFSEGTLCLGAPVRRTPGQTAYAQPAGQNCIGAYDYHFSQAYMAAQTVNAGDQIYAQHWSRDPGFPPPNNVGLTNALHVTILP